MSTKMVVNDTPVYISIILEKLETVLFNSLTHMCGLDNVKLIEKYKKSLEENVKYNSDIS